MNENDNSAVLGRANIIIFLSHCHLCKFDTSAFENIPHTQTQNRHGLVLGVNSQLTRRTRVRRSTSGINPSPVRSGWSFDRTKLGHRVSSSAIATSCPLLCGGDILVESLSVSYCVYRLRTGVGVDSSSVFWESPRVFLGCLDFCVKLHNPVRPPSQKEGSCLVAYCVQHAHQPKVDLDHANIQVARARYLPAPY